MSFCDRDPIIKKNGDVVETTKCTINTLKKREVNNMVLVGGMAPSFTAPAYYKGSMDVIDLENYRGKWVVLCFYPGDFTFVCGTEVATIASRYEDFQKLNTEVISVSVDSQFVHKIWDEQELSKMANRSIPFPMVTDSTGELGEMFGVYNSISGVDVRGRFIIDPDGIIQAMEVLTPPVGRNVNEVLRQLQAYQHVRETNGKEYTPAGWIPGGKTLKPSNEMVGNVWKYWNTKDLNK